MAPTWVISWALLTAVSGAFAQQQRESDLMQARSVKLPNTTMYYRLFVPKTYSASKKYPIVVSLHGVGERGNDNRRQVDFEDLAHPWIEDTVQAKVPHFVMLPQCPTDSTWGGMGGAGGLGGTGQGIMNALDSLKREFSLDTNRFYITGLSMGGAGTYNLLRARPGYFAAAVPCAAGGDTNSIPQITKTPLWHHHGSLDGNPPGGRRMAGAMEKNGIKVVRFVSQAVITAPSLTAYRDANRNGQSWESLLGKGSNITWDSLARAVRGGSNYLYSELTGGDHRSGWMIAWHNPLLAEWLFSKVKSANVVSIAPKPAIPLGRQTEGAAMARRTFSLLGRQAPVEVLHATGLRGGKRASLVLLPAP